MEYFLGVCFAILNEGWQMWNVVTKYHTSHEEILGKDKGQDSCETSWQWTTFESPQTCIDAGTAVAQALPDP